MVCQVSPELAKLDKIEYVTWWQRCLRLAEQLKITRLKIYKENQEKQIKDLWIELRREWVDWKKDLTVPPRSTGTAFLSRRTMPFKR